MLNAKKGLIKYFPEPLAVYRRQVGTWTSQTNKVLFVKWLKVLTLLLKENFEEEVKNSLRSQWGKVAASYLNSSFPNDLTDFYEQIKIIAGKDPDLLYECVANVYPPLLNSVIETRSFKLARKMSHFKNKTLKFKT